MNTIEEYTYEEGDRMSDTYWTSDLHIGHANIAKFCPGRNTLGETRQEQDETLIERINMFVRPQDTLYVLGDVAMGPIQESLAMLAQINGRKLLVPGNHDRCWIGDKRHAKWMDAYREVGFEIIPEQSKVTIGDRVVNVCHFPYEGDSHGADRHGEYRIPDDGVTPIIHGHVHDDFRIKGRQFNVGVDANNYIPVPQEVLEVWVQTV